MDKSIVLNEPLLKVNVWSDVISFTVNVSRFKLLFKNKIVKDTKPVPSNDVNELEFKIKLCKLDKSVPLNDVNSLLAKSKRVNSDKPVPSNDVNWLLLNSKYVYYH